MNSIEPVMPWALGPDYPRWTDTLRNGKSVTIRPITADDVDKEREFIESLSPESRRYRFLGQVGKPSEQLLAQLTEVDYRHDVALAAIAPGDGTSRFIGVARYYAAADDTDCECAVTVLDEWQHRGLGTILMRHLIEVAESRGIKYMFSLDAAGNVAMADLARFLGFDRRVDRDDPTMVLHSLWLASRTRY